MRGHLGALWTLSYPNARYISATRSCAHSKQQLLTRLSVSQIFGPNNEYLVNQKGVSSGDHSFDARNDGKHLYCFSNELWSASTKEVSFNVHGIVYVPESEAPSDPLEVEGVFHISTSTIMSC